MFQQVFPNYFKAAEFAIQFQHELLRQWSGQWPTAPLADGRTEQVRAMQKKASDDSSEMLNLQRRLLAMLTESENKLIEDVPRMAKAAALSNRQGDVDAQTAVLGGAAAAPTGLPAIAKVAAQTFRTGEDVHADPPWDTIIADDEESRVLHLAYLKWLEEGCPEGQDRRHYFEALQESR